jgi:hypothetical protein
MPLLEEMSSYPFGQLMRRNMLEEITHDPDEKITCKKVHRLGHFRFLYSSGKTLKSFKLEIYRDS